MSSNGKSDYRAPCSGLPGKCACLAAFTLAELLIALAILGVIATFTIPKVLQSQQDGKYKSIAKEAAGIITRAYAAYRLQQSPSANTQPKDLAPFINYVRYETNASIDHNQTNTTRECDSGDPCLILHNGAALRLNGGGFGDTATTNAIAFFLDPDGKVTGNGDSDGPGKSVMFYLYLNGRLQTRGTIEPNTCTSSGCVNPNSAQDPPWFSWD